MEGLRAYAALLIFIVHYFDTFSRSILGIDLNTQTLGSVQDPVTGAVFYLFASHYGVDLFFFLSGFLIYRIVSRSGFSYPVFVKRRLLRIYPTFLASLFVWACVRIPIHHAYPFDLTQLLGNLMFLNAIPALGITPYNAVTWSLFYEFVFYLLFPAILLLPGHKRSLGPWHVIGFGILFIYVAMNINPYLIRFMMFFGGALMASLRPKQLAGLALRIPDSLVIVCYLASTAWFSFLLSYQKFIPVFLVTSFLLVLKVLYGNGLLNRIFMLRWFRYLGNISYSFYLLHGLAIELVMGHLAKYFMELGMTAYLVFTFGLALLLAVVFSTVLFLLTEKPYFTRKQHDFSAREGVGATA
jgi:peptidoglycan/LPS O-acetylase OafA/YrhL